MNMVYLVDCLLCVITCLCVYIKHIDNFTVVLNFNNEYRNMVHMVDNVLYSLL